MKRKFIIELDDLKREKIKKDLKVFFKKELDLTVDEMEEELELAMSSRLVDLEETIDISKYI